MRETLTCDSGLHQPIPMRPRTQWAAQMASSYLLEKGICALPVDARQIAKNEGMRLRTYSRVAEKYIEKYTIAEICEIFKSQDAITFINNRGEPVIVYNDTIGSPARIEWSILHEAGHYLLGHFTDFDVSALTQDEQKLLDVEADVWAANIKAPICLMDLLKRPLREGYRDIFGLSRRGWEVRQRTVVQDRRHMTPETAEALKAQFHEYMYSCRCEDCKTVFIGNVGIARCPACGSARLKWRHWDDIRATKEHSPKRKQRVTDKKGLSPDDAVSRKAVRSEGETQGQFAFRWMEEKWSDISNEVFFREAREKARARAEGRLHEYYMTENPMVVDEFWG